MNDREGFRMKRLFALLCGVILVGCGNTETHNLADSNITNQESSHENSNETVTEENHDDTQHNHEETEDDTPIAKDENGVMHIETVGFVENMDKLFVDLDDYVGETLTYEGLLIQSDEETGQHAVVRVYEMDHGDHEHSIYVGLDAKYDGEWPELNSWVKVTGTIEVANQGGEDYPVLNIKEIELAEKGELTVVD